MYIKDRDKCATQNPSTFLFLKIKWTVTIRILTTHHGKFEKSMPTEMMFNHSVHLSHTLQWCLFQSWLTYSKKSFRHSFRIYSVGILSTVLIYYVSNYSITRNINSILLDLNKDPNDSRIKGKCNDNKSKLDRPKIDTKFPERLLEISDSSENILPPGYDYATYKIDYKKNMICALLVPDYRVRSLPSEQPIYQMIQC